MIFCGIALYYGNTYIIFLLREVFLHMCTASWASVSEPHTSVFNFEFCLFVRPSVHTVRHILHIVCVSNTPFKNISYHMHIDISSLHVAYTVVLIIYHRLADSELVSSEYACMD